MIKKNQTYLLVLLALIPVLVFRDYTPSNELRYLSIADEALGNGTFVSFTYQGLPYADKPPLYLWIVMLCKWLFGQYHMWFLSLFSLLPAFVIVRVMDGWVAAEASAENRRTWRWLLLTCALFLGLGIVLRMDMLMCMFITLALRTFYKMWKGEGPARRLSVLFPVYVFLAVFSKGPVGILVPLLCTIVFLVLTKTWRTMGRYWGWKTWGILVAGCALWFGAVYAEGGYAYLDNLLFHQTIDRAVNSFHHEEPFYYYFISIWYSLAPWSFLLLGLVAFGAWRCRKGGHTDLQKFFLTVAVTTFVMLSLISSKIAVYLLPAFPFIAYAALLYFPRFGWNRWLALSVALPAGVFLLALPGFVAAVRLMDAKLGAFGQPLFYAAAAVLSVSGAGALWLVCRQRQVGRAVRTMACGLFCAVFVGGWSLPRVNAEIGYGELCREAVEAAHEYGLTDFCVWRIRRPEAMDVYLGQQVEMVQPDELAQSRRSGVAFLCPADRVDELPAYFQGRETRRVGKHVVMLID